MKKFLAKFLIVCGIAASFGMISTSANAYRVSVSGYYGGDGYYGGYYGKRCHWVGGHYRHGVWYKPHKVCYWGGHHRGHHRCAWINGHKRCW